MSGAPALHGDPVLALLADAGSDPRALYYLWEQQQWEAGKVELALDAEQWRDLDPAVRRLVADSVAWRRLRAEVATVALVPFVDVAPNEEEQVFLTTQLVDEARHLVFFDRVHAEVTGNGGVRLEDRRGAIDDPALASLLGDILPGLAADLRAAGAGVGELVAGTAAYHLVILGALGLTDQEALKGYLRELEVLPGIRRGLELEARDAQRHVAFGLGLVGTAIDARPDVMVLAQEAVARTLPEALSALSSIAAVAPAPYPSAGLEVRASAALQQWFDAAGLEIQP